MKQRLPLKPKRPLTMILTTGIIIAIFVLAVTILPLSADARVGGGESYGGSGGSSGSSGSSGESSGGDGEGIGELIFFLVWLHIEAPYIAIPLDFAIIGFIAYKKVKRRLKKPKVVVSSTTTKSRERIQKAMTVNESLKELKKLDPNFSRPLFMDFVHLLFVRAHQTRGSGKLEPLSSYLSPEVRGLLLQRTSEDIGSGEAAGVMAIDNIVVGSGTIVSVEGIAKGTHKIAVEFEANYRYRFAQEGREERVYYTHETWTFSRQAGVLSKGPEEIATFQCPNCGDSSDLDSVGRCPSCGEVVNTGDFHWVVNSVRVLERHPRSPIKVGRGGVEVGTEMPDVIDPDFDAQSRALIGRDPEFRWERFLERGTHIFMSLQQAWSELHWELARPYETDYLFSSHSYWIENFKASGIRNVLEDITIRRTTPVKVEADAYYDSITVRFNAAMKDYKVDTQGKVVEGDANKSRIFSEYWTFIRRSGAGWSSSESRKLPETCPNCGGAIDPEIEASVCLYCGVEFSWHTGRVTEGGKRDDECPSCGAPLNINQVGICEYCGSKVTTGEFDWVLSAIEQDEAYSG